MQVSTELLVWTDVTCNLLRRCTTLLCLSGSLSDRIFRTSSCDPPSPLLTDSGLSLTPADKIFITSSSSSTMDFYRSSDAWAMGLWDSLLCSPFGIQWEPSKSDASGSVTCDFLVEPGMCNRSPGAWLGFSWSLTSDCVFLRELSRSAASARTLLPTGFDF